MGVPKKMPAISAGDVKGGGYAYYQGVQFYRYRNATRYDVTQPLKAPFPYPGGKSDVAAEIWSRLGDVGNYVEPFAGSAAATLGRPHNLDGKTETLNDIDGMIVNAYRAITFAPDETAVWCDFPVSECDLTARNLYLKAAREELTLRLFADPFYFEPQLAGLWLYGAASWIGDGWCVADGPWIAVDGKLVDRRTLPEEEQAQEGVSKRMPEVGIGGGDESNRKANARGIQRYRNAPGVEKKMPSVSASVKYGDTERGVQRYRNAPGVPKQMPEVGAKSAHQQQHNKGIQAYRNAPGVQKKMPEVGAGREGWRKDGRGVQVRDYAPPGALLDYFERLAARLRRVRFLCGDWRRCVKDSITVNHGLTGMLLDPNDVTGVFLDPPYPAAEHDMAYHEETAGDVWYDAAAWAVEHGDNPLLRICVAGYFSEATDALFPASWQRYRWQARGGYANQKADGRGRENAKRECLWFNASCIDRATDYGPLFAGA